MKQATMTNLKRNVFVTACAVALLTGVLVTATLFAVSCGGQPERQEGYSAQGFLLVTTDYKLTNPIFDAFIITDNGIFLATSPAIESSRIWLRGGYYYEWTPQGDSGVWVMDEDADVVIFSGVAKIQYLERAEEE